MRNFHITALHENPEFQSSMVRLGVWVFAAVYVSAGAFSDRYDVDMDSFVLLFAVYLFLFLAFPVSVLVRPQWEERRYVSLATDISATTFCIYLTGEAYSPFFILYIWAFVSYGARYGERYLFTASVLSIVAYLAVMTLLNQWREYPFEASFVLLTLGVLPVYQCSLMRQLYVARREADRSNRMVDRFLSDMTSEMRGPLVDILATTKKLFDSKLSLSQLDKVNDIDSSASLLDSAIGDVLDFYKLEAKQLKIQSVPFNLHALITEACSAVVKPALIRRVELVCSVASEVPRIVLGDEQRLKQVLINVLKSAINGCAGDELQIRVRSDDANNGMLLFEIRGVKSTASDPELGLDDDLVTFDDISSYLSEYGPDLGNNFAGRLISLMGGEFGSGPKEEEIVFWFTFPVQADDYASERGRELSGLQGKKVFVFEPNKTCREEIIRCCADHGMLVESVEKVGELSDAVLDLRQCHDVDIILIADSPSGRDIERIVDICLDIFGGDLPIVVLAYKRSSLDLNKYGSARFVRKPFIREQLLDAMESALSDRGPQRPSRLRR